MKVKILQMFHDKVNYNKVYLVGETVTFDDQRAEALIARGLVENDEEVAEPIVETEYAPTEELPLEVETKEDTQAEELLKVVKPVATKRKSQSKDN